MFREPFIVQRYLKDVRKGDKRIILIDGEPVGAINRVPAEHDARSNMHVGGRAEKTELTEREREICARIGPSLKERGFILVGIDVIGDYMTEINVTSPTGMREVQALRRRRHRQPVLGRGRGQAARLTSPAARCPAWIWRSRPAFRFAEPPLQRHNPTATDAASAFSVMFLI